jgi:hypothetical protein
MTRIPQPARPEALFPWCVTDRDMGEGGPCGGPAITEVTWPSPIALPSAPVIWATSEIDFSHGAPEALRELSL